MEAEYVAMSMSLKNLLPLMRIVKTVAVELDLGDDVISFIVKCEEILVVH